MILFLTSKFSQKLDDQHKDPRFILLLNQTATSDNSDKYIQMDGKLYMLGQEKFLNGGRMRHCY